MCLRAGCDTQFDEVWDEREGLAFSCSSCGLFLDAAEAYEVCKEQNQTDLTAEEESEMRFTNDKEANRDSVKVLHRYTEAILYASETATTIADCVTAAIRSGADLRCAYLSGADLRGAYLRGAHLRCADLRGAYLRCADLRCAYLRCAYLRGADLRGADLSGADLRGAKGISAYVSTPLMMLLDQPGKIRAYKLVMKDGSGPFNGGITYEIGGHIEVLSANTNQLEQCAEGINVATLDWCIKEWKETYRILVVEFEAKDIAAIPVGTDGKFRLFRCNVVAEKSLEAIGGGNAKAGAVA